MIYLFIAVAAGILFGTVLLWLSGYYSGQALTGAAMSESLGNVQSLQRHLEGEQKKNRELQEKLKEHKNAAAPPLAPPSKTTPSAAAARDVDTEVARLTSEITRLEGALDKALFELDTAKEELEIAQEKLSKNRPTEKPTSLPKPQKRESKPHSESEALDELQAELDMEKVAHQLVREDLTQVQNSREQLSEELTKTRRELEQVKKLAALQFSTDTGQDTTESGSRFKTMAIGMRSPTAASGNDQSKLQSALEKTQSELERTKKELQLLKMRNENSSN
ncbi:MAG: hypothetical protein JXX14_00270 [Deltaproteobacteria bacterium]|nr:hypothetical protein [Deltaproteobacteria bacterium]